jgi:multicomponent K+:H+ antiporter subunit D
VTRVGIDAFWASPAVTVPRVQVVEMAPVALLLALSVAQTIVAGPVMRYMEATAQALHAPSGYIRDIMPEPGAAATDSGR